MIISISGHIGAGKDLVGSIIQYLIAYKDSKSLDDAAILFCQKHQILPPDHWQIKKWADKLKDITCLILDCTREQLEDREFKETPLGEEWRVYYIHHPIIGNINNKIYSYYQEAMANLPMDATQTRFTIKSEILTPRRILQLLGTECGREILHPNIWVNSLMQTYNDDCNWIITDTRFPNELSAVRSKGGISINVVRPSTDHKAGTHPSETALTSGAFMHTIINDGTIKDLMNTVKIILIAEGII